MTQKLQQAIQLARNGDKQKAQYLLTQTLQEEPENAQAWYLLSLLVDSETKQTAYLQRVLALDPTHEKAQARLAELLPAAVMVEPEEAALSDWLDEDEEPEDEVDWFAATAVADSAEQAEPAADLPDWLYEDEDENGSDTAADEGSFTDGAIFDDEDDASEEQLESLSALLEEAESAEEAAPVSKGETQPAPKPKNKDAQLTAALVILVILAILVGAFLIYLLITL